MSRLPLSQEGTTGRLLAQGSVQLKVLGMNTDGFLKYYCAMFRSLIIYGAPAWNFLLNDCDIKCLERVQKLATRAILPKTISTL